MTTGVNIVYGIVIAIAIEVQTIYGFRVQVSGAVRRNESAPLGGVVSGVAVIQAGIIIVVVATVTDGVGVGNIVAGSLAGNGAITPGIIQILCLQGAVGVVDSHHIALEVSLEVVEVAYTAGGQLHTNDAATNILPFLWPTVKKKPPRP